MLLISIVAQADVSLPSVLSDNMVLQQKTNAGIWGTATPNSSVKIYTSWNRKSYIAKADSKGTWKMQVATPAYGGPYSIKISQGNTIELKNILIGEVWVCSGQSNMEMPLAGWGKVVNYEKEIADANYPKIRLLQAIRTTSNTPLTDLKVRNSGWDVCTPETVADFSSTAYFFAREVYNKTKIPVGLIHTSWGGTIAEAWTSYETLKTLPDFAEAAEKIKSVSNLNVAEAKQKKEEWDEVVAGRDIGAKENWQQVAHNDKDWKLVKVPDFIEKNVRGFDGVIWFRKKIIVPKNFIDGDFKLSLGSIDDEDITWVNGIKIGATKSYTELRNYEIPSNTLKEGENVIAVRVFDGGGEGGFYGDPGLMFLQNRRGEKISLAGDWNYKVSYLLTSAPDGPNRPTVLYNAMINPIINYTICGAIWYQGESNAGRAYQYRTLFPSMIKDWRMKFSSGDFPFYFVQLANFMKTENQPGPSAWAELREAQLMTTKLKNTGMATIIDVGDAEDIHPKNKQEVGRRLALIALNKIYKRQNEYSGPLYQSLKKQGDKIVLTFTHAKGLHAKGDRVLGFAIAGADKKFYWADAKIKGNQIIVSSKRVVNPEAVRYGWANNPEVNVYNDSHLPASPFRTDIWQESTFYNK